MKIVTVFLSIFINLLYYAVVSILASGVSIHFFFVGMIANFPSSFIMALPAMFPTMLYLLGGFIFLEYPRILVIIVFIALDLLLIKFLFQGLDIGISKNVIRIIFDVLFFLIINWGTKRAV